MTYREAFEKYRQTDKGKEAIGNYENSETRRKAKTEWMRNYRRGMIPDRHPLLPYNEAKKVVQSFGIKNSTEYKKHYDSGKFPKGMPSNPALFYTPKMGK